MTKYLITGAQGLVGRYLAHALLESQSRAEVIGVGRSSRDDSHFSHALSADRPERAPLPASVAASLRERFVYHQLDVLDRAGVRDLLLRERPDVVYHLAASLRYAGDEEMVRTNVIGTLSVLDAVAALPDRKPRVVLGSSCGVYGTLTDRHLPVVEGARCEPVDVYGASKLAAEQIAIIRGQHSGVCVVIARIFNICGPGQDDTHVCGRFASLVCSGLQLVRVRNLQSSRDFIDVRDVATALILLGESGECGSTYNVAAGMEVRISSILDRLVRLSGFQGTVVSEDAAMGLADVPRHYGDTTRLRSLGFECRHNLDDSLRDLLAYIRANRTAVDGPASPFDRLESS